MLTRRDRVLLFSTADGDAGLRHGHLQLLLIEHQFENHWAKGEAGP